MPVTNISDRVEWNTWLHHLNFRFWVSVFSYVRVFHAMSTKRTILSLDQRMKVLRRLVDGIVNVQAMSRSTASGWQLLICRTALQISSGNNCWMNKSICVYSLLIIVISLILDTLIIPCIIQQCMYSLCISLVVLHICCCARCNVFGGTPPTPSLWWAATCHVRTLLPGPKGVRPSQVLL